MPGGDLAAQLDDVNRLATLQCAHSFFVQLALRSTAPIEHRTEFPDPALELRP